MKGPIRVNGSLPCFLCDRPSDVLAEMPGGVKMPACNACFLDDDAQCSTCGHTLIDHVGIPGPGLPEQALMTDCDFGKCDCNHFRREMSAQLDAVSHD